MALPSPAVLTCVRNLLISRFCRTRQFAGVAQLVERNLAKVEVESSRLFSRSSFAREAFSGFPFHF